MTVILVLATFAVFLLVNYLRHRKAVPQQTAQIEPEQSPTVKPAIVAGFEVRSNLRYHPGHTWALAESPNFVRVGLDEFAARLIGTVNEMVLPKRGQWLRQGQKFASVGRGGTKAELVSPIEGEVTGINESLATNPSLLGVDPYGEGWLITVVAPDIKTNFRNLLNGDLASRWMEEASAHLRKRMSRFSGAMAQDGGRAVDNLAEQLPDDAWHTLLREFFLT